MDLVYSFTHLMDLIKAKNITFIYKRDGQKQSIDLEKISDRLKNLAFNLNHININLIIWKVVQGMYEGKILFQIIQIQGITTLMLDNLAAETCAYMNLIHPQYSLLAARIAVNNLHKETNDSFKETITRLYTFKDKAGRPAPLIADDVYQIVMNNAELIQNEIDYQRDYNYDFFGFKTLERSYLLKDGKKPIERPQQLLMRVSIGIHKEDLQSAFQTYHMMSQKYFTHATPTLFNSGTPLPQMSSCFLLDMVDDSIDGIYETLKRTALISKSAGGIGLSISKIRAQDSYIRGTNGISNGLVPMLRVFNDTARYVDQGGGKRKGSFAVYLEPWHSDIISFLQLRKNTGVEEQRCRDLFLGLWIPDLFMMRVKNDQDWTLMCPNECPGLQDCHGEAFNQLYLSYESRGLGRIKMKARALWQEIIDSQISTGLPYMLYKDACNAKSNQQNLGTIKSSNLCTEIIEYTSPDEVAVCNLASINLQKLVKADRTFDYDMLLEVTEIITINLNKIIDLNYYPIKEAENSNKRHRPIGIGVQGMADALIKMRIPFESEMALEVNSRIFETIYYGAVKKSQELAEIHGPYSSFQGSPASKGQLQFDLWNETATRFDWTTLKQKIVEKGMRNSLLIAPMPTASTSQILQNNESFEPYTSNVYTRRVLAGEFVCVNPHLVQDLLERNLWNSNITNKLIQNNGSVQNIDEIPKDLKQLYKTVWEISQKAILNLALARAPFIDQSQSLNIHLAEPNMSQMTSMHFYAWERGLKTGMYYLRSRPAADPIKFTVDVESLLKDGGQIQVRAKQELADEIDKKILTNDGTVKKKSKLKTVPLEDYKEDMCFNCGS
ncbi:ribonucleotide-diphosphate reductase subunit rnr1 [Paramecium bursaria]